MTRTCKACGAAFVPPINGRQLYCDDCRKPDGRGGRRLYKYTCYICGDECASLKRGRSDERRCSKESCKAEHLRRLHARSKAIRLAVHRERLVYRKWSRQVRARERQRLKEDRPTYNRSCHECGEPFSTRKQIQVYCSARCQKKNERRRSRLKRSAVERAARVETVNVMTVFDRDRWRCQLCGTKTPRRLRGTTNPNAPELDHIIPLAKGGEHSYINTQCSCRQCNQSKSDAIKGQLLMFG